MRLFAGTSEQFIQDSIRNEVATKLRNAFFDYYRYNPSPAEINSWRNSLKEISDVFVEADLTDHGVILEYQLPLTSKRLDCLGMIKKQLQVFTLGIAHNSILSNNHQRQHR